MYPCEFCQKSFASKSSLNLHQKTTKYCLNIQGKYEKKAYECNFCKKSYTTNNNLDIHLKICEVKEKMDIKQREQFYIDELRKKDEIIKQKDEIIASFASKQSNIIVNNNIQQNNNQNQQSLNLNDIPKIQSVLDQYLDKNVLADGQKGLARLIYDKLLTDQYGKPIYKCVDASRQNFEYVDEYGNIERDIKANKLKNALIKGEIRDKALDIGPQLWKKDDGSIDNLKFDVFADKVTEVSNLKTDDTKFRSELAVLTS